VASERKQLMLLGAIVIVFIAVVWWQLTRDDGTATPVTPAPVSQTARAAVPAASATGGAVPVIALAALKESGPEPVDTGRDPFRFEAARPAAPAGGGGARAPMAPLPPQVVPVAPTEPPGPPPPPPIQLRYIGSAKQGAGGRQLVVLRDDRGIYYGGEGDVIEGRYRILRVAPDSVDVAYVDGRGRRTITLTGGQL
jgi:hypothetical protein